MTDIQSLRDDIDYVKSLAREGHDGPIDGFIGFGIGLIWTLAALAMWAEMVGLIRPPEPFSLNAFLYAVAAQVAFMAVTIPRLRRREGLASANARRFGTVWAGMGLTTGVLMLGVVLTSWRRDIAIPWVFLMPIVISLYGGAWFVCALVARRVWMGVVAAGCAVGVVALALLPRTGPDYMLSYAACLFLFGACPGLYGMWRNAKART